MHLSAEDLSCYVPDMLLEQLVGEMAGVSLPAQSLQAAALFADISGFTALTEKLAADGAVGVEEISHILNAHTSRLIDIVARHGGDIVRFEGDGLLALWSDSAQAGLAGAVRRAAACGLHIQRELHHRDAEGVRLTLRVGVGCGAVFTAAIESAGGRCEFLAVGEAVTQSGAAERQAAPGQVRLSSEAWALVRAEGVGQTLAPSDFPSALSPRPARPPTPPADVLARYVPRPVMARLAVGQTAWIAELRQISVVFVRFDGLDVRAELDGGGKTFQLLHETLGQFEGTVVHTGLDAGGPAALCAFGLPPWAHEDDALRAVSAAAALRSRLRALGQRAGIGIAMGYVFCGVVGDARRCDYTLIGDAVNVAARLMQSADETPLCDAATRTAVGASYLFDPLPPVAVKGKAAPVPVFSARARAPRLVPPFAGAVDRSSERARLAAHLEELLTEGRDSVVIVEGEAGIGKSHLAADLAARASGQNVVVLTGGGDPIDQAALYHAWRPVFSHVLGLDALTADPDLRRAHVLAQLSDEKPEDGGPSARERGPLLAAVLSLDLPDNAATALLMGRERAEATHDLLTDLLRRCAEEAPLLLIMEDVHWLDSASWTLLLQVAARVSRRMLVVLTRGPDAPSAELDALTAAYAADRMVLGPLRPEDMEELACRRLGVRSLPESVAGLIRGRADGNPFFCEELASSLRDRGAVVVRESVCELAPDAPDLRAQRFPETAQGVVLSRIDRLTPQQQLILKVASVIGRSFDLRVLRAVYPVPGDLPRLSDDLDVLAGLGLTPLEADEPERRYAFKHAITQDVAYRLMLYAQRQPLHLAVARWYEDAFAADDPSVSAALAFHWARACETPPFDPDVLVRAVAASRWAGELALRGNAATEAITHLTRALALLARMPESLERDRGEVELQVLVAIPYTLTRGWAAPPVEEAYRRAYALCLRGEESPQLFPVLTGIFTYHLVSGQMVRADEISLRNWEYAERAQDPDLQLEAEHDRCTALFYRGDLIGCVNHAERVLQLFDPNAHQSHLFVYGKHPATTALCHVSLSRWCLGFPDRALEAAYAGVRQVEALPHPFSHAWALAAVSVAHRARGEVAAGRRAAEAMIALSERYGFPNWLAQGLCYAGWANVAEGDVETGLDKMQQGIELWQRTGAALFMPFLLTLFADALLRAGRPDEAAEKVAEALAVSERTGEHWGLPATLQLRAQLHARAGRLDQAEADLQQALTLARAQNAQGFVLRIATSLAQLWRDAGRAEDARTLLAPALAWFTEGLDTQDLREARAVLASLAVPSGGD